VLNVGSFLKQCTLIEILKLASDMHCIWISGMKNDHDIFIKLLHFFSCEQRRNTYYISLNDIIINRYDTYSIR